MYEHPFPSAIEAFPMLRQSTLGEFDNCGLSAKFSHEYASGWSTHPQGRGSIFHMVAGECLKEMFRFKHDSIPADVAIGILHDVLRMSWADKACPSCGTTDILPGVSDKGRRQCAEGHEFETELVNVPLHMVKDLVWCTAKWAKDTEARREFNIRELVDVEQRLKADLEYIHEGVRYERTLTGKIDVVFVQGMAAERAVVYDWKDTWSLPPSASDSGDDTLSEDGYFQQRFYAWLIFRNYPSVQEVTLREWYVRYSEPRNATFKRRDMDEIEEELSALAYRFDQAWENQTHRPTPGKHCSFCARPTACPIPRFAAGEGKVVTHEGAEKLARQILVAEEVLKQARKAMRAYCDTHGPIQVKDAKGRRELGYQQVTRTVKPDPEAIKKAEVEKGAPLTAAEIEKLYVQKPGTRFGVYTPKDKPGETPTDADLEARLRESIAYARRSHGFEGPADDERQEPAA